MDSPERGAKIGRMKVAFFSAKAYDRASFEAVNTRFGHELVFLEAHLNNQTAALAAGCGAACTRDNCCGRR